jgi:hypothetical protein
VSKLDKYILEESKKGRLKELLDSNLGVGLGVPSGVYVEIREEYYDSFIGTDGVDNATNWNEFLQKKIGSSVAEIKLRDLCG